MALFKPYKILSNKLSSLPVKEGQLIIITDTGDIYVDLSDSERKQLAVTDLSDYVTSSVLASSIAAEAQAREKQDGLLEDAIEGKLDAADLVEGSNITISADDNGHVTIAASLPDVSDFITETEANAAYATKGHTHSVATDSANGFMSAADKEKLDTVQEGANKTVVDSALSSTSTNPVQNKVINSALAGKANSSHSHSAANITSGVFDAARIPTITNSKIESVAATKLTGTIPQANLPSYVDDVLEYSDKSNFPDTGEAGKIYVDTSTNKTYRWGGSSYVEISASLALGTTSSTAFRGDYGNTAYQHATAKGSAFASGLYKITTNSQGHVTAATAVTKSDITALGIPGQDTNTTYGVASSSANGLMSAADKAKLDGIASGANKYTLPAASSSTLGGVKTGANITNSSGTISITKANVVAALGYTPPTTNTTYSNMTGATSSAAGKAGLVPAPAAGKHTSFLRGDGTWVIPTNTTYSNMTGATTSAAGKAGLVPAPAAGAATRYLRSDGTWQVPPDTNTDTNTTYTLTKSGSTITLTGSNGSKTSVTDSNTTYSLSSFGITATAAELNKLDGCTATVTELNYVDGVTSNIQTQLNGKAASSHTHNYAGSSSAGGNANAAVKLATARNIGLSGDATGSISFNGTANVNIPATVLHHGQTSIGSKANLNSYTDPGWYTCPRDAVASTLTNCPTKYAFALIVSAHAGTNQILIEYMTSGFHIWTRNYYSNAWSSWAEIYTTVQKPTASEIGAAASSHTHPVSQVTGLTASRALISDSSGHPAVSAVTSTELGYLDGVTSAIQTQLNGKAASSHNHSAANITSGTLAVARGGTGITVNPSLLVNLGSASAASVFAKSPRPGITGTLAVSHGGTGATSAASARSNLGAAASDIITVSSTQPSSSTCKLWIKP